MTRYGSADVAFLLAGGRNILGDTTEIEDSPEAVLEDTTVLGIGWEEHSHVGVNRYELSQQGFYDDETDRSNDALQGIGLTVPLNFAPEGGSIGDFLVGAVLVQATYKRQIQRAALTKASATYKSAGVYEEGVILHALGEETADGDTESDSHDAGASSADGAGGWLQVMELDLGGYDDVTIRILDSDDDMTFGELIAFTDVADAPAAEHMSVSGTVERYTAVDFEFNGSGSSPSVTFMAGLARY